jgi:hypothetical protein
VIESNQSSLYCARGLKLTEHVCCAVYTNRSDDASLVSLAMHDTCGPHGLPRIAAVKDIFADFLPLDRTLFGIPPPASTQAAEPVQGSSPPWRTAIAEAATAVAAALRCSPLVRYQGNSKRCEGVARSISELVSVRLSFCQEQTYGGSCSFILPLGFRELAVAYGDRCSTEVLAASELPRQFKAVRGHGTGYLQAGFGPSILLSGAEA